jgi:copper chaperone NosL
MKNLSLITLFCLLVSCSKTPQAINYGKDMCHFCQMTIVTKTHASQMVTGKGKQFKFDAIECMIHFLEDKQDIIPESQLYITNYTSPGEMIDAKTASYAVSPQIGSPMGANLTGFLSLESAKETITTEDASFYDWNGIFAKLN